MKLYELKKLDTKRTTQDAFDNGLENIGIDTFKKIKAECGQFLNESKAHPMYRAMKKVDTYEITPTASATPRDSSFTLTGLLNLYFEEKFGIKGLRTRNRIYVNGDPFVIQPFLKKNGDKHFIFPCDGYKYVWSPMVQDATNDLDGRTPQFMDFLEAKLKKPYPYAHNLFDKLVDNFYKVEGDIDLRWVEKSKQYKTIREAFIKYYDEKKFTNKNLVAGIESNHEIVFQLSKYYALPLKKFYTAGQHPNEEILAELYQKICKELLS